MTNDKSLEKHRALDDVVDTIKVVNALLMRLKDKENKSMTLENLTFRINTTLNRFGLNKWSWSEIIDRGNYNINNIDVIYENEEIKNKSKKNLKNTLINHRFNYEHLLKNKELWQSKKGFNYEFRPGQFELSKLIRETMNTSGENIACIEAPTGIGKSVGYLLPSIMESYLNHKRIIISTDTKELQTQLIKKDIPNVIQSLGLEDKIRFGYIKGKSNYICVEKLEKYIKEGRPILAKEGEDALFVNAQGQKFTRQGLWKVIKKYANKANISKNINPSILRHSFAIHLLKGGANVAVVGKILGNSNLSSLQLYLNQMDNNIRKEIKDKHPRKKEDL